MPSHLKDNHIKDFGEHIGGARKELYGTNGLTNKFYNDISLNLQLLNSIEKEKYLVKNNIVILPKQKDIKASGLSAATYNYLKSIHSTIATRPKKIDKLSKENRDSVYFAFIFALKSINEGVKHIIENNLSLEQSNNYLKETTMGLLFDESPLSFSLSKTALGELSFEKFKFLSHSFFDRIHNFHAFENDFKNLTWENNTQSKKNNNTSDDITKRKSILKQIEDIEHLSTLRRDGESYFDENLTIDTEVVQELFNFKGGEFGNWVNQKERQAVLQMSTEAFLDLAATIGAKPSEVSLNSSISIAFGSRGKARTNAHYEPMKNVIALTRLSGGGALAHEWFHAFDHFYGKYSLEDENILFENSNTFISKDFSWRDFVSLKYDHNRGENIIRNILPKLKDENSIKIFNIQKNILEQCYKLKYNNFSLDSSSSIELMIDLEKQNEYLKKYKRKRSRFKQRWIDGTQGEIDKIEEALGKTTFFKDAEKLDNERGKDYYATDVELMARAFESYILDSLDDKEYMNDYLVLSSKKGVYVPIGEESIASPYPRDNERDIFKESFSKLMNLVYPDNNNIHSELSHFIVNQEDKMVIEKEVNNAPENISEEKVDVSSMRQLTLF